MSQDLEHLVVYLLTQDYLQEEYQQTAYTCNVYLAPGPLAARLRYHSRESVTSSKVKVEFHFLKSTKTKAKKRDDTGKAKAPRKKTVEGGSKQGKKKAVLGGELSSEEDDDLFVSDDTGKVKAPQKRMSDGNSKKGKNKAVYIDSDDGELSSVEEDDFVVTDYTKPLAPQIDSDDICTSDEEDAVYDWETFAVRDGPPSKRRRKSGGFKVIQEGENEVMVLSSD